MKRDEKGTNRLLSSWANNVSLWFTMILYVFVSPWLRGHHPTQAFAWLCSRHCQSHAMLVALSEHVLNCSSARLHSICWKQKGALKSQQITTYTGGNTEQCRWPHKNREFITCLGSSWKICVRIVHRIVHIFKTDEEHFLDPNAEPPAKPNSLVSLYPETSWRHPSSFLIVYHHYIIY